jgi:hypothetical protein
MLMSGDDECGRVERELRIGSDNIDKVILKGILIWV